MGSTLARLGASALFYFGLAVYLSLDFASDFYAVTIEENTFGFRGLYFWLGCMILAISTIQITAFRVKSSSGTSTTTKSVSSKA